MALSKEKVKDIKLIFKQNTDKFIPKIWVCRTFPNGYTHNHSVYIWSLDCIQHVQYSLHFVCHLAKFIMKPTCCDPTVKEVSVTWMNNLLDTSFNAGYTFPHAQRLEKFLLENMKTVEKIYLKLDEIKEEISPNETVFSKLDSIPTYLEASQENMCFTCGEVKIKARTCKSTYRKRITQFEPGAWGYTFQMYAPVSKRILEKNESSCANNPYKIKMKMDSKNIPATCTYEDVTQFLNELEQQLPHPDYPLHPLISREIIQTLKTSR